MNETKTTTSPKPQLCLWCKGREVGEPNSFVELSGGALIKDKKTGIAGLSSHLEAFLALTWHGAHDEGEGPDRDFDAVTYIAHFVRGGGFGFYFCSTTCLREFLSACVDRLDQEIASKRVEMSKNFRAGD
jgi:hypothetical protein